jgi:hypothetical protein
MRYKLYDNYMLHIFDDNVKITGGIKTNLDSYSNPIMYAWYNRDNELIFSSHDLKNACNEEIFTNLDYRNCFYYHYKSKKDHQQLINEIKEMLKNTRRF